MQGPPLKGPVLSAEARRAIRRGNHGGGRAPTTQTLDTISKCHTTDSTDRPPPRELYDWKRVALDHDATGLLSMPDQDALVVRTSLGSVHMMRKVSTRKPSLSTFDGAKSYVVALLQLGELVVRCERDGILTLWRLAEAPEQVAKLKLNMRVNHAVQVGDSAIAISDDETLSLVSRSNGLSLSVRGASSLASIFGPATTPTDSQLYGCAKMVAFVDSTGIHTVAIGSSPEAVFGAARKLPRVTEVSGKMLNNGIVTYRLTEAGTPLLVANGNLFIENGPEKFKQLSPAGIIGPDFPCVARNDSVVLTNMLGTMELIPLRAEMPVFRCVFKGNPRTGCFLANGRFALAFPGCIEICTPPDEYQMLMIDPVCVQKAIEGKRLQTALDDVLHDRNAPNDYLHLVRQPYCAASLAEWHAAHELLMLAVEDGTVARTPHHDGVDSFWLQQVYAELALFQYHDDCQKQRFIRLLRDAQNHGVLESSTTAAVISGMNIVRYFTMEMRALRYVGVATWKRLLEVERDGAELSAQFLRYRNVQRRSQLVGIAVSLIPIAGGSLTGLLTCGADVVGSLSAKDVTDGVLGLITTVAPDTVESLRKRLLIAGKTVVSEAGMKAMEEEKLQLLMNAISEAGLDVSIVREWFDRCLMEVGSASGQVHIEEVGDEPASNTNANEAEDTTINIEADGVSKARDDPVADEEETVHTELVNLDVYKLCMANAAQFTEQTDQELASSWAAYIVAYRDDRREQFSALQSTLVKFLEDKQICAEDLCGLDDVATIVELEQAIVKRLTAQFGRKPPPGVRIRAVKFFKLMRNLQ